MAYPSDISRAQFKRIRPILERSRKKTKPRELDLYDVFNALLYITKTACQWRALPKDYPDYRAVHYYFRVWSKVSKGKKESTLDVVLKKIGRARRTKNGRKPCTSMAIVDAQSVKNTETAHLKGYDGGKKVSGIKRHIAVDTNGLPHAIHVTAASVTDRAGAIEMAEKNKQNLRSVKKTLVDGGYTGEPFRGAMKDILDAEVEVAKRSELHTFAVIPKRWVVERSLSWLEKCRRLWKNCERLVTSSVGMVQLAFIRILLKRI
ncbi:IS5 family transposase [Candidatus Kaiserbacteria bacterium]|nr:IS5 family transposase [Candidatus Kaiserbacteria bacterium]